MYGYAPLGNIGLTFPSLPKEESNPLAKCQSTMEVNILVMVLSSNESMDMIFIWRVNRSEMSLRPPPGGPMADTNSWNKEIDEMTMKVDEMSDKKLNMRKSYFPQTLSIKIIVYFANNIVCKLQRLPTISMSSNLDVSLRSYQWEWSNHCRKNEHNKFENKIKA